MLAVLEMTWQHVAVLIAAMATFATFLFRYIFGTSKPEEATERRTADIAWRERTIRELTTLAANLANLTTQFVELRSELKEDTDGIREELQRRHDALQQQVNKLFKLQRGET